ncbi:MAG: DUF1015 family protein, partial [bacterium]|nr:DUF1015 family protein [bacterium]
MVMSKIQTGAVQPFRGILYQTGKGRPISSVVAPPYDVISPEERTALYKRHPDNVVRLILPGGKNGNSPARYKMAANTFKQWFEEGVLERGDRPALYYYAQTFSVQENGK